MLGLSFSFKLVYDFSIVSIANIAAQIRFVQFFLCDMALYL